MRVLSIDPGNERSGYVVLEDGVPVKWGWEENELLRIYVRSALNIDVFAVEYMRPRGMPTAAEEMDTMYELGRMVADIDRDQIAKVSRHEVKMAICGRSVGVTDSNIRAALIDRFGGQAKAVGGVKCKTCKGKGWVGRGRPACLDCQILVRTQGSVDIYEPSGWESPKGVLYGISGHVWSALACGVTYLDQEAARLDTKEQPDD